MRGAFHFLHPVPDLIRDPAGIAATRWSSGPGSGPGRVPLDTKPLAGSRGRLAFSPFGPYVCVGCCSQLRIWHDFGNRSYVSGLLIGSRAVALMGLRTRLGLISGKVLADHKGRQTLGASFLRSMLSSLSRTPFDRESLRWFPWPYLLGRRTGSRVAERSMRFGQVCWPTQRRPCCAACALPLQSARNRS